MASIQLRHISKAYQAGAAAVSNLTLEVTDGELLVLVGPSGSGKSTVLRLIAGLETADAGQIVIGGRDVSAVPPQQRDLAMVFQNYALYPHKTVRQNLAFSLKVRGLPDAEIEARVHRAAGTLGIADLLHRKPAQLSGGQRQRVALGRAIVREPQAFLLDEPLSNLDPRLRVDTRAEIAMLHRRLSATMVYVTHDQEEAMTLGERIAVMRGGAIEQLGPPLEVYRRPANAFVAGFIGSPAMNIWPCRRRSGTVATVLEGNGLTLNLDGPDVGGPLPATLLAGVRPHDIDLTGPAEGDAAGVVEVVEPLGAATLVHLRIAGADQLMRVIVPADVGVSAGEQAGIRVRRDRVHLFDAETGRRTGRVMDAR